MTLSQRLKELRGDKSQKQFMDDFEKETGFRIKQSNYSNWENGRVPSLEMLKMLASYHGVSLDYLTGFVDYKNPEYAHTVIETGLSENAIRGIQHIQNRSNKNNDQMAALNFLLEQEASHENTKTFMFHELLSIISNRKLHYDPQHLKDINVCDQDAALIKYWKQIALSSIVAQNVSNMVTAWRARFQSLEGHTDEF